MIRTFRHRFKGGTTGVVTYEIKEKKARLLKQEWIGRTSTSEQVQTELPKWEQAVYKTIAGRRHYMIIKQNKGKQPFAIWTHRSIIPLKAETWVEARHEVRELYEALGYHLKREPKRD